MQGMQHKTLVHTTHWCSCRPPQRPFTAACPPSRSAQHQTRRQPGVQCQRTAAADHRQQPIYHISAEVPRPNAPSAGPNSPFQIPHLVAVLGLALVFFAIKKIFDTPSRTYKENVGDEYDSWTDDGVLEYYWGEHIHLGYYTGNI